MLLGKINNRVLSLVLIVIMLLSVMYNILLSSKIYASSGITVTCPGIISNIGSIGGHINNLLPSSQYNQIGTIELPNPVNGVITPKNCSLSSHPTISQWSDIVWSNGANPPSSCNTTCSFLILYIYVPTPSNTVTCQQLYNSITSGTIDGDTVTKVSSAPSNSSSFASLTYTSVYQTPTSCSPSNIQITPSTFIVYTQSTGSNCGFVGRAYGCTYNIAFYYSKTAGGGSSTTYNVTSACTTQSGVNSACVTCVNQGVGQGYDYIYTDFGCVNTSIPGIINFAYRLILIIGFMLALAVIIFAGYLIMVSGGDPEQLGRGKSLLTKAIIGLLVIVFAYIILTTIGSIFGINFLT